MQRIPLHKRIRRWFVWVGGWEFPNSMGWELFHRVWIRGRKHWRLKDPTPVALFGHRFVHYGWGLTVRLGSTYFCWTWEKTHRAYLSPNGTPTKATRFFWGHA